MRKISLYYFTFLLCISCGSATTSENNDIVETSASEQPVDSVGLQLIASDLVSPVFLTQLPNDDRLFVVDQVGVTRVVQGGSLLAEPFLDLRDKIIELKHEHEERGLLGLAFHPEFQNNGRFFVYYSAPLRATAPNSFDHTSVVAEYKAEPSHGQKADPGSERVLLQVNQPQYNHNAGTLMFGPSI